MKIQFLLLLVSLLLFSCNKDKNIGTKGVNSELAEKLRSQPETLEIEGQNYILSTYIWRDFFPPAEPNGSELAAVTKLIEVDSLAIPNSFSLERVYILKGDEIFTSKYSSISNSPNYILSGTVVKGPKWKPNSEVDVVCVFKNNNSNTIYKILVKSQMIHKTQ